MGLDGLALMMPEWRLDPITGEPVIIAEGRIARPVDDVPPLPPPATTQCPFCEGHEEETPPEIAARRDAGGHRNGPGWKVRVIPNKFPTFVPADGAPPRASERNDHFRTLPAVGIHEVVIQHPAHGPGLPFLPFEQVREVVDVYRERLRALEATAGVRSVILAENCGPDSGGSLAHPHGQLLATPEVLPGLERTLQETQKRAAEWGVPCPVELLLSEGRRESRRLVWEDDHFVVIAPYASTLPYQLKVVPRRDARSLSQASDEELKSLAGILPRLERALLTLFPGTSYNVTGAFPSHRGSALPAFHWSIDLLPRLVREDAFELASWVPVNPIAPEIAAERYRTALTASG